MMAPPLYLVSHVFPPRNGSAQAGAFARGLARGGWDVTAWTLGSPSRYIGSFCEDPTLEGPQSGVAVMRTPAVGGALFSAASRTLLHSRYRHPTWAHAVRNEMAHVAERRAGVFCASYPEKDNILLADDLARQCRLPLWLDFREVPVPFRGLLRALETADAITFADVRIERALLSMHPGLCALRLALPHGGGIAPTPVRLRAPHAEVRLIAAGPFHARRDLVTLVESARLLRRHLPDMADMLEIILCGEDAPGSRGILRRSMDAPLRYEGFQPHASLMHMVADADALLLVLPEAYPSGAVPDAACEAFLCGTPVLACAPTGALADLIVKEGLGLLAPAGDAQPLAEAVARFTADGVLRETMRAHVLAARDRFHAEALVSDAARAVRLGLFGE